MATRAAPEERSGWQDLGFCLHALGRNADARLVLHEAAARFPEDVSVKALAFVIAQSFYLARHIKDPEPTEETP